jgi:hypothetical protein
MRTSHYILAIALAILLLLNSVPVVRACGKEAKTEPIYVSRKSPDLPFKAFTNGKIGIVRPSFGRKTLFIAYRYLNGGSFTTEEQNGLIKALNGTAPEGKGSKAVKEWIAERKQFLKQGEKLPEIYAETSYGDYRFFPNCTKNAFEVALQTLKYRVASYGAEDRNVNAWVAAQDTVFLNCSDGSRTPTELGADSPMWLRKDRDYQIAASYFYSLKFDEARERFEKIAADADSPWKELAGYLVARTFVRQASLGEDKKKKPELYEQAEMRLQSLVLGGGKYAGDAKKLLSLVKYHLHPEERVVELSRTLTAGNNENLRQDLIDYVWLLDRFETQILEAEEERKQKAITPDRDVPPYAPFLSQAAADNAKQATERLERFQRGEVFPLALCESGTDGKPDCNLRTEIEFRHDASEAEIVATFEQKIGRKLNDEEVKWIRQYHDSALKQRQYRISPNRKWERGGLSPYEGCYDDCGKLTFDLMPAFLREDDLSDWILTTQTDDPRAYRQSFSKWKETGSSAWMLTALVKAETSSPRLAALMQAASKVTHDDPAFPTVTYHLIRLKAAMGQTNDARRLLDQILSLQPEVLPISAQNQFLEQRMYMTRGLDEFLRSAQRKPATFYNLGTYGKIRDFLRIEKSFWNRSGTDVTKEEFERARDEKYESLLPWDDRVGFDYETSDLFNWHIPVQLLADSAHNPNLPDYLQRNLVLVAWTRAIVLDNDELARKIAPEVPKAQPEMTTVFQPYLQARTPKQRHHAALYILLKFPKLSPFVESGLPEFHTSEEIDYNFEDSWWWRLLDTDYKNGVEVPRVVPKPSFLSAAQLEAAARERRALISIGDAMSYLDKQVIDWAKTSPDDERLPEALFIAAQANEYLRNSSSNSESDENRNEAKTLLRQRYPQSPWTAKLSEY